ncbi:MAG: FAD-binding oxidoreductase [Alcanivoracaceae bacterium]|nr:FAD-binding oxidoreductase [Alcanivoracaceae bacterium]
MIPFAIKHRIINKLQLEELEPEIKNCQAALYFPDIQYSIDPHKFALRLFSCFISMGGQFIRDEVTTIESLSHHSIKIKTSNQNIKAKKLIISAGIFSKELVKNLGINVPLETERGYHLMLPQQQLLNRPVAFAQRRFIITPMQTGTRLAGTVEFAGTKTKPNWKRAENLFHHAKQVLNSPIESASDQKWMGFRPTLPDSLPIIDHCCVNPNILFAFGHQHLGLTQAGITADIISDLVHHKKTDIDISPFSVNRF